MCMPKEEAKSLVERLVESMDRLTHAVNQIERRMAPQFDERVYMRPPYPPAVVRTLDDEGRPEYRPATTAEIKAALNGDENV